MLMAVIGLASVFVGIPLFAGIVTFTSRDAWLSFIQNQPNYGADFNLVDVDTSFASSPQIFNAFNVTTGGQTINFPMFKAFTVGGPSPSNGNLVDTPPFMPQPTNEMLFNTTHPILYGDPNTTPVWKFLRATNAFGADYQVIAGQANFAVTPTDGGAPQTVAGPRVNGFFGIATDTPGQFFNAINFQVTTATQGPASSFLLAFDNVSGIAQTIPEPSGLTLILTGALALAGGYGGWRWRSRDALAETPVKDDESKA
jgi:hypothetical protein